MSEEKGTQNRIPTSFAPRGSPPGCILTRLMRTLDPLKVPSYTHPRRESDSMHDFGRTSLAPHILPSSRKDSWNTGVAWSEILAIIYNKFWTGHIGGHFSGNSRCPDTRRTTPTSRLLDLGKRSDTHLRKEKF